VPTVPSPITPDKEAVMPVENDVHPHHRGPITVADRSRDASKPASGAPSKSGPARPTPGNADAPVKPLRDIKPDPKRALSSEIDAGLRDIRSGKFTAGETQIANGIKNVVMHLTGEGRRTTYAAAKRATDEILAAYSQRLPQTSWRSSTA
jgi:hypothetical protein